MNIVNQFSIVIFIDFILKCDARMFDDKQQKQPEWINVPEVYPLPMKRSSEIQNNNAFLGKFGLKASAKELSWVYEGSQKILLVLAAGYGNESNVEYIEKPENVKFGACRLFTKCVPLPYDGLYNTYHHPNCIDLPVCTGGCCSKSHKCRATRTSYARVKMKPNEFKIGSSIMDPLQTYYLQVEKHDACECN